MTTTTMTSMSKTNGISPPRAKLRSPAPRWHLPFLALLAFVSLGRCGSDQPTGTPGYTMVRVHVEGALADLQSLRVTASLDGAPAHNAEQIDTSLDLFVVYLPISMQGELLIDVTGLAADQCKLATGQSKISIPVTPPDSTPAPLDVTLTLATVATKMCTLTVTLVGNGQVISSPPGLQCNKAGTCSQEFPAATQVTLHAVPGPANVASWSGDCSGSSDCALTVDRLRQATIRFAPPPCTGWCPYSPLTQTNSLRGLWGSGPNNVWAVGLIGTIMHFDGTTWTIDPKSGQLSNGSIDALWGSGPNDVWAVGETGKILHYNGQAWSLDASGVGLTAKELRTIWGSGASDVWAMGDTGTILHFNGSAWSASPQSGVLTQSNIRAIPGIAQNDVWATGSDSFFIHFDGNSWTLDPKSYMLTTSNIHAAFAVATNDVWGVGALGILAHYNGQDWSLDSQSGMGTNVTMRAVWASSGQDIWNAGTSGNLLHYDGTDWSVANSGVQVTLWAMWGSSANNIWAAGDGGTLLRYQP